MYDTSIPTTTLRHPCHPTAERRTVLIAALYGLLSLVAYGCAPAEDGQASMPSADNTGSTDAIDLGAGDADGPDVSGPRLPTVASRRIDADDCELGRGYGYGAPMDFVAYVHAADDFVVGLVERIEPVFIPFQPDHRGEIPAEECEPDMVRPAFDLVLSDVWSARGSVEASVTIRLSGDTWSRWGTYPEMDESGMEITWSYEPGVEVPPIVPGMQIGGAVYRHPDIAALWFNTMSEPLFEVVGDAVLVQEVPGRISSCAPAEYRYLEDHVVADAWDELSVDEWQDSVAQILAETVHGADVLEARAWALNPYGNSEFEVYPTHARAYCVQRTLRNDWFCDDGRRPFICPLINDEPCECECTYDCLIEGEICMPDNTCAAP